MFKQITKILSSVTPNTTWKPSVYFLFYFIKKIESISMPGAVMVVLAHVIVRGPF